MIKEFEHKQEVNIAILVFDGVYLLDFTGPMEVFNDLNFVNHEKKCNVYTVSYNGYPVETHTGLVISPKYSFNKCPTPDVFIIPGGKRDIAMFSSVLNQWITKTTNHSKITLSVCTGAFILAKLGLLDKKDATTWHGALIDLAKVSNSINVIPDVRYTDNGKIITTAGITAGIDGSLYVVEKIFGLEVANKIARFMDYNYWQLKIEEKKTEIN